MVSRACATMPLAQRRQNPMHVIPVIDLKGGIVVHARRGARAHYRALETPFAKQPDPIVVVNGLLAFQPFAQLYVADLDAIAGGLGHRAVVTEIAQRHPALQVWLDAGFSSVAALKPMLDLPNVDIVLGSESLATLDDYRTLCAVLPATRWVLSLDRGADGDALGCRALFDDASLWPTRVIHMTLARVGAAAGPDLTGLERLRVQAPRCALYAAGGVRDEDDLRALAARGVAGALVATALHEGRIAHAHL